MKKVLLLVAGMMFLAGTAFGAAADLDGLWTVTIPQQYVMLDLGFAGTVNTSMKEFQITVSGSTSTMVETSSAAQLTPSQLDTDGVLHPISTPTGFTGTASGNMINPMATTGVFFGSDPTRPYWSRIWCDKILDDPTFSDPLLFAATGLAENVNAGLIQTWTEQYYGFIDIQVDWPGAGGYSWFSLVFYMEPADVPVPAGLGLLIAGMVGLVAVRRKNR